MDTDQYKKEVLFTYCNSCANQSVDIEGDPSLVYEKDWKGHKGEFFKDYSNGVCHDCLDQAYNYASRKPKNYKPKEES